MLKSCKKLSMTVRSPSLPAPPSSGGAPWQMRQTCSWMDRQGRPVSPPIEYIRSSQMAPQRYSYGRASSKDRSIRRVSIYSLCKHENKQSYSRISDFRSTKGCSTIFIWLFALYVYIYIRLKNGSSSWFSFSYKNNVTGINLCIDRPYSIVSS